MRDETEHNFDGNWTPVKLDLPEDIWRHSIQRQARGSGRETTFEHSYRVHGSIGTTARSISSSSIVAS